MPLPNPRSQSSEPETQRRSLREFFTIMPRWEKCPEGVKLNKWTGFLHCPERIVPAERQSSPIYVSLSQDTPAAEGRGYLHVQVWDFPCGAGAQATVSRIRYFLPVTASLELRSFVGAAHALTLGTLPLSVSPPQLLSRFST